MPNSTIETGVAVHEAMRVAVAGRTLLFDRGSHMPTLDEAAHARSRYDESPWAINSRGAVAATFYGPPAFGVIYRGADYDRIESDIARYYATVAPESAYATKVDAPARETLTHSPAVTADLDLSTPRRALALEAAALLGYGALAKDAGVPGELRRALAKLELEMFDEKSVDAYKAQMVQHYASHQKMAMPTWRLTSLREYTQPVPEHVLAKAVSIKRELPQAEFYVDQLAVDPFLIVTLKPLKDTNVNTASRKLDPEVSAYIEVWDEPKFEEGL